MARRTVSGDTSYSDESLDRPEIFSPSRSSPAAIRSATEIAIRIYWVNPSLSIELTPLFIRLLYKLTTLIARKVFSFYKIFTSLYATRIHFNSRFTRLL